ncbi:MAG TPA: hypothetical protein PKM67_03730 [Kiritimatiellia bacterium]|nr:hypothetical protein [Kiritimatiellia bacterium]
MRILQAPGDCMRRRRAKKPVKKLKNAKKWSKKPKNQQKTAKNGQKRPKIVDFS